MKIEVFKEGMPVVYLPSFLLSKKEIEDNQLGIVSSVNDIYVFVKYNKSQQSQATKPDDLYLLDNRPDLLFRLGVEVKPINRICELWLEERELFAKQERIY